MRAAVVGVTHATESLCVFRVDHEDGQRFRAVARDLGRVPLEGESWHLAGTLENHPHYGRQLIVDRMQLARPEGRLLRQFLAGERFPGVGDATVDKLWRALGRGLLDVLDRGDRVALTAALGEDLRSRAQIDLILSEWPLADAEPRILAGFDEMGVPPRLAAKLFAAYGQEALDRLTADPYRMLAFAAWKTVDAIALRLGISPEDPRRRIAACEAALYSRLRRGDTLAREPQVLNVVGRMLDRTATSADLDAAEVAGALRKRLQGWQATGPALMEEAVGRRIAEDRSQPLAPRALLPLAPASRSDLALNAGQAAAVAMALSEPFSMLVGGAGTGKTTTLKAIYDAASAVGQPVEMMALAGRAALRIREATDAPARTIAGWLAGVTKGHVDLSGLPLIIIDEASMVDLGSLYRIMSAAPHGCRFLLVGDDGQLPPVGFGLTFHALLGVDAIPRTVLTEVMRQAAETGIPSAAESIRAGIVPQLANYRQDDPVGVSIAACATKEVATVAADIRRSLTGSQIVGSIKGDGSAHDGGIIAMNRLLHDAWAEANGLDIADWLPGEPVIWTVNDYDLELWNGSLGRVVGPSPEGLIVHFDEGRRTIAPELLDNLELAWAITTHKAQGSAFDTVVVPVTPSQILDRALLYTAVTRARKRVVLVGDPIDIKSAAESLPKAHQRQTWLREAVHGAMCC